MIGWGLALSFDLGIVTMKGFLVQCAVAEQRSEGAEEARAEYSQYKSCKATMVNRKQTLKFTRHGGPWIQGTQGG